MDPSAAFISIISGSGSIISDSWSIIIISIISWSIISSCALALKAEGVIASEMIMRKDNQC